MIQQDDQFLTEELSRYSSLAQSHLRDIRELRRITDEEIRRVSERISQIRARNENNLQASYFYSDDDEDDISTCMFSMKLLLISPFIIVAFLVLLYWELKAVILTENVQFDFNEDFSLLESEVMYVPYAIAYAIVNMAYWSFLLLLVKLLTKFDKTPKMRNKLHVSDLIYFNPFFFNMVVFFYNKSYISTIFDLFCIMTISSMFTMNFILLNHGNDYFRHKINSITNIHLDDNKSLMVRMRIFFSLMLSLVMFKSYIISFLTSESDWMFVFLIQFKTVYTTSKYFSLYYENEITYKQLDNSYATKEENYLHTQKIKSFVNILNMSMMVLMLMLSLVFFYKEGGFFLFVPIGIILLRCIYNLFELYKSYKDLRSFFTNLEQIFPVSDVEADDKECIICTERLTKARGLVCGHYFHLICLSKWIEKGSKNCPLCRKEIDLTSHLNLNNLNTMSQRSEWNFSFRNEYILSWLGFPSITFGLVRMPHQGRNRNQDLNEIEHNENDYS